MGKPAARQGDMTAHGGSIVVGFPTVFIGGMPAARQGDMHVCPMLNPGTPPPPHVGGPIMIGSVGVFIGGMPAARMGDMATCAGPPDTILGGCPTVLIGEIGSPGGGGGGGGGPSGGKADSDAEPGTATGVAVVGPEPGEEKTEDHFLHIEFVDSGGFPVAGPSYTIKTPDGREVSGRLNGLIKWKGVEAGDHEITLRDITSACWSCTEASVGDQVKLTATTAGLDDGTIATIHIFMKDFNQPAKVFDSLEATVQGDKVEAEWSLEVDDKLLAIQDAALAAGTYSAPFFFFYVMAQDCGARSGLIRFKDKVEIKFKDDEGNPMGKMEYQLKLPNGEIRKGKLDDSGKATVEDLPPGRLTLSLRSPT